MYEKHFGLRKKPFELTPSTNILFLGSGHKTALSVLKKGVLENYGFLVFTGGVGTGKTTLINVLSNSLDVPAHLCVISNPVLNLDDFFQYLAEKLGLKFDGNLANFLDLFSRLLEEYRKKRRKVLLIIDEAHDLPTELFEELWQLVNMTAKTKEALTVFLIGQPELRDRLEEDTLNDLRQSILVNHFLSGLSLPETLQYILFRLNSAGAESSNIFTEEALPLIYEATGGNPRKINILCDNALLHAYAEDSVQIDGRVVRACAANLTLAGDDKAYYLRPAPQKKYPWLLLASAAAGVLLIGLVVAAAYTLGWIDPVLQSLSQLL